MASASLNISVVEKRMLSWPEGADYCGVPRKKFKTICPVRPVDIDGVERLDKRDLDKWIDELKEGRRVSDTDDILAKLG